jgi:hypothetical protein
MRRDDQGDDSKDDRTALCGPGLRVEETLRSGPGPLDAAERGKVIRPVNCRAERVELLRYT